MKLEIVTPDGVVFSGEVSMVTVPGTKGSFTVLENHAPIISTLEKGKITYRESGIDKTLDSTGGFVEVNENVVSIAIEVVNE